MAASLCGNTLSVTLWHPRSRHQSRQRLHERGADALTSVLCADDHPELGTAKVILDVEPTDERPVGLGQERHGGFVPQLAFEPLPHPLAWKWSLGPDPSALRRHELEQLEPGFEGRRLRGANGDSHPRSVLHRTPRRVRDSGNGSAPQWGRSVPGRSSICHTPRLNFSHGWDRSHRDRRSGGSTARAHHEGSAAGDGGHSAADPDPRTIGVGPTSRSRGLGHGRSADVS